MVIRLPDRSRSGPDYVKVGADVVGISSDARIELRDWYVCDLQLLPGLCFICFEYLIERLLSKFSHPALLSLVQAMHLRVPR